jgi:hypothetical protein
LNCNSNDQNGFLNIIRLVFNSRKLIQFKTQEN